MRRARPYDLSDVVIHDYLIHTCWFDDGVRITGYTRHPGSDRISALVSFIEIALGRASELATPSSGLPCLISREALESLFKENARWDVHTWTNLPQEALAAAALVRTKRRPEHATTALTTLTK